MLAGRLTGCIAAVALTFAVAAPLQDAEAVTRGRASHAVHSGKSAGKSVGKARFARSGYSGYSGGISCVPFARENTGIELSGNAREWWDNAAGVYARGAAPEVGSILNFRANGRMRSGHVAVVTAVGNPRTIQIDHANWGGPGAGRGSITRNITVIDVSDRNDWSAVRVALGHTGDFGSVYPTYGFIYDRADTGTMIANRGTAPAPMLNAAPRDLRPGYERTQLAGSLDNLEVAEAVDEPRARTRRSTHHARGSRVTTVRSATVRHAAPRAATVQKVQSRPAAKPAGHKHRT